MIRNGIIRSILQPVFEYTTKAALSAENIVDEFTTVVTPGGPVGLGVINAQPLTAEAIHKFLNAVPVILEQRGYVAVALIAGDSMYVCVPWTAEESVALMSDRVNVFFRRLQEYTRRSESQGNAPLRAWW